MKHHTRKIVPLLILLFINISCNNEAKKLASINCDCFEQIKLDEAELEFHFQMNKCFSQSYYLVYQESGKSNEQLFNKLLDELEANCTHYNQLMKRYMSAIALSNINHYCSQDECLTAKKGVYKVLDSYYEEIIYFYQDSLFHINKSTGDTIISRNQVISSCMSKAKPFYSNNAIIQQHINKSNDDIFSRILAVHGDTVVIEGVYTNQYTISRQLWISEKP